MQKELKILDKELSNNQLVRIQDSVNKHDQSLFRALSASIYYSHIYANQIKLDIRLALASNLSDRKHNPYLPLNQSNILQKYISEPQLVMDFWDKQDLQCFHNDNLLLASAVFGMQICLLTVDKQEYLNQTYIVGCKNPKDERINLAKVGKRFYCVLENQRHTALKWIRQLIYQDIIEHFLENDQFFEEEDHPEEKKVHTKLKQHKKSLSDCRQLSQKQIFPEQKIQAPLIKDVSQGNSPDPGISQYRQFEDISPQPNIEMSLQNYEQNSVAQNYNNYYGYQQYPYMMSHDQRGYMPEYPQAYSYVQPSGPINGERYTGRLKFFDQSGNYGFLVIDTLNSDLFVHFDDLSKAGLSKEKLLSLKNNYQLRFEFTYYEYQGKQHKKSKKAVDLQLIE